MKTLALTLGGILLAAIGMPALAGPNWDVIHEAEAQHLARHEREHVLPLDHGPRAITTPWLNKVQEGKTPVAAARPARARLVAVNMLSRPATAHNY